MADANPFETLINDLAKEIYSGKIGPHQIPAELSLRIGNHLNSALNEAIPPLKFGYTDPENRLAAKLRANIYSFAAAKSLEEMKKYNQLLLDNDGKVKPFKQYRDDCTKAGLVFNIGHLKTEREFALASAQTAVEWQQYNESEILQWSTIEDEKTCPICGPLDGVAYPKNNGFWKKISPPVHFHCRCRIIPAKETNEALMPAHKSIKDNKIPPYCQNNAGVTEVIFDNNYPMMNNLQKSDLSFDRTYNMPTAEHIYSTNEFKPAPEPSSPEQAYIDWHNMAKDAGEFDIKDLNGTSIHFDQEFYDKLLKKRTEGRWKMIPAFEEILKNPDEVWFFKGRIVSEQAENTAYIKYYKDEPYMIIANYDRATTAYPVDLKKLDAKRRGILMHRK